MDHSARELISAGASASAEVLERVFRIEVEKAIDPLDPAGFVRLQNQYAKALLKISGPIEREHLVDAMKALDVDWPNLTAKQRTRAFQAANSVLIPLEKKVIEAVKVPIEVRTERVVSGTRKSTIRQLELKIPANLSETDKKIAQVVASSQSNFVRDEYGRRRDDFSARARSIVSSGIEQGLGRNDIAEDLQRRLGFDAKRSESYWQVVSNAFVNRARSWTQLSAFSEAGIEKYRFEAVLDEHTTETCRFLHGKIFTVALGLGKLKDVEKQKTPEGIKSVTPWVRTTTNEKGEKVLSFNRDGEKVEIARIDRAAEGEADAIGLYSRGYTNDDLESAGLTIPPLHALCRSTLVGWV